MPCQPRVAPLSPPPCTHSPKYVLGSMRSGALRGSCSAAPGVTRRVPKKRSVVACAAADARASASEYQEGRGGGMVACVCGKGG